MSNSLIQRLSEAAGPDNILDADIAVAVGIKHRSRRDGRGHSKGREWFVDSHKGVEAWSNHPPDYTASLDAALTLVPEGYGAKIHHNTAYNGFSAASVFPTHEGEGHVKAINVGMDKMSSAIAICIAALRARVLDG